MNAISKKPSDELQKIRKELREKILQNALLDQDAPTTFSVDFSGYGDSGQMHDPNHDLENGEVGDFFHKVMSQYIHFDWYNNDGGGGDITWDVVNDKIKINGYSNRTVQEEEVDEEI